MMSRIGGVLLLIGLAAGLIWVGGRGSAAGPIDAGWARAHDKQFRRILNLRPTMRLEFKGVKEDPAAPDYYVVQYDLVQGTNREEVEIYVTRDGRRAVVDREYDLADPFRAVREQIVLEGAPTLGPPDAPLTVVEYVDYTCGYCRLFAVQVEKPMLERYEGKLRLVIKHFPILSPASKEAARAAICVHRQSAEKFWALHDKIFEDPSRVKQGRAGLRALAEVAGADAAALAQCMDEPETKAAVDRDFEEGQRLGVGGTPNFFINGRHLGGLVAPDRFFAILDEELQAAQPPSD